MKPRHIIGLTALVMAVAITVLEVLGTNPVPAPGPTPTPTPGPAPIVQPTELLAVVIEESEDRTPEHAMVLLSPTVRKAMGLGRFLLVDKDKPAEGLLAELIESAGDELPTLFFLDQNKKIVYKGPLPETEAAFVILLGGQFGGEKNE